MKTTKLLTGALLALALLSTAQAGVTRITGSTAFRANTTDAILAEFDNTPQVTYAYVNNAAGTATVGKSVAAIFKGNIGGAPQVIKTHFTGSEGGIQTTAGSRIVTFLSSDVPTSPGGTVLESNQQLTDSVVPDVTMADSFQSTSRFKRGSAAGGGGYVTLNATSKTSGIGPAQIVGIVPFQFVSSLSAPNSLRNMTDKNARALFSAGRVGLALFTGLPIDTAKTVYATGRDIDSGTRLQAFAETGLGALATVKQYQPRKNGHKAVTAGGTLDFPYTIWPSETVNGITEVTGNGGYSSGGDLANALGNITPNGTMFASYLGVNDAITAVGVGAHTLKFNGYDYRVNAIKYGQYTFWGYEHLYYRDNIDGDSKFVADKLARIIYDSTAPAPKYIDMKAKRIVDGGTVFPLY